MAYATASELFDRHDIRLINDLANDDNVQESRSDLLANTKVATALEDATAAINTSLVVGKRYSAADLAAFTALSSNEYLLKRMTSDIAWTFLLDRRPTLHPDELKAARENADYHLDRLRSGADIFDLDANKNASLPTLSGPTSVDYSRMNLIPERTPNFYPNRSQRLPTDRR